MKNIRAIAGLALSSMGVTAPQETVHLPANAPRDVSSAGRILTRVVAGGGLVLKIR